MHGNLAKRLAGSEVKAEVLNMNLDSGVSGGVAGQKASLGMGFAVSSIG